MEYLSNNLVSHFNQQTPWLVYLVTKQIERTDLPSQWYLCFFNYLLRKIMHEPNIFWPCSLNPQLDMLVGQHFSLQCSKTTRADTSSQLYLLEWFPLRIAPRQEARNLCRCFSCSENRSSQDSRATAAVHHCALIAWIDSWCRPPTCNLIRSPVKHIP